MNNIMRFTTEVSADRPNIDRQSLVLQYDKASDLSILQDYVRSRRGNQSNTRINNWIEIDGFVNLDYTFRDRPENRRVRVIYECLEGNPSPSPLNNRFPDCYILHVDIEQMRKESHHGIDTRPIGGAISKISGH
jgi:hypothetical protein